MAHSIGKNERLEEQLSRCCNIETYAEAVRVNRLRNELRKKGEQEAWTFLFLS